MDDFSGDTTKESDSFSPNLVVFETESHSVAQAGHEVVVVLSQSLEFWDYRCIEPYPPEDFLNFCLKQIIPNLDLVYCIALSP